MTQKRRRSIGSDANEASSFEREFHQHLGRLVHETARFDFFAGLQLNWLGSYCGVDVAKYLDPNRVTLGARLDKLKSLVGLAFQAAGPAAMAEFEDWFNRAASARALRNNYAHGHWAADSSLLPWFGWRVAGQSKAASRTKAKAATKKRAAAKPAAPRKPQTKPAAAPAQA